jgi:hypothetical protein
MLITEISLKYKGKVELYLTYLLSVSSLLAFSVGLRETRRPCGETDQLHEKVIRYFYISLRFGSLCDHMQTTAFNKTNSPNT